MIDTTATAPSYTGHQRLKKAGDLASNLLALLEKHNWTGHVEGKDAAQILKTSQEVG